jgi:class 3 adenylate cyclase
VEFYEQVDQVQQLVARHGRVSRRGLERTYGDAELVTELAEELIVRGVAAWDADVLVARPTIANAGDAANAGVDAGVDGEPAGGGSVGAVAAVTTPDAGSVTEFGHDAQIRHLTVMFCDVVGSTALSGELGAEVWTDAMRTVLSLCADHVRQWQGHVGAYLGDGVLAYFGYPIALENAGERAVRASLGILAGLPALNDSLRARLGRDLEVRIGIHSGPVVVDEVDGWVQASGLTTNIAARVQGEASPNSIAMTAATQRLVSGVFITEDLGVHQLKGVPEPLPLQRVVGFASPSRQRALARHATRFAGRRAELEQLEQRWAAAEHGEGQTVVLVGEAGIGKSRLIDHFRRSLGVTRHTWLEARGSSFANAAPLTPIAQLLRRAMALDDRAGVETIRVAVERAL